MKNLYIIDRSIENLLEAAVDEETGEIVDADALEAVERLGVERDDAIEDLGIYYKNLMAEAKAVADEKKNLFERQKALEHKAEGIKTILARSLNGEKFSTPKLSVSFRKSQQTQITDLTKIPMEYLKWSDPTADKEAIKRSIKAGNEVPGAELVDNISTIIK